MRKRTFKEIVSFDKSLYLPTTSVAEQNEMLKRDRSSVQRKRETKKQS